jgi:hypothetical protein
MVLMRESSSNLPSYAYEVAPEGGRPSRGGGLAIIFRYEPVRAGQRLTLGGPPDEYHRDVLAVEPTSRDGQRVGRIGPLSGPPGGRLRFPEDAIWSGRLILRPLA